MKKESKVYVFTQFVNGNSYTIKLFKSKKAAFSYAKYWKKLDEITIGRNAFYKAIDEPSGYEWTWTKYNVNEYGESDSYDFNVSSYVVMDVAQVVN